MLDAIKKYVSFVNVPAGGTATLPHGLILNSQPLTPDHLGFSGDDSGNFVLVSADTVNLTVRNDGPAAGTILVLAEAWHPIERSFGISPDDGSLAIHLTPRPFVMKSGGPAAPTTVGQVFDYTVTGAEPDRSAITITIPTPMSSTSYEVMATIQGGSALAAIGVSGKTLTNFVLDATGELPAGVVIGFVVLPKT